MKRFVKITLRGSRGGISLVSANKLPLVSGKKWYLGKNGYVMTSRGEYMHRVIMSPRRSQDVDHINFDRLDNRDENLLVCSRAQNRMRCRRHRDSRQPYKGVAKTSSGKWKARICFRHRKKYLGSFDTPELAAAAYDRAAKKYYKKFAVLNLEK